MKKTKYFINEKGKKRILIAGTILIVTMLFLVVNFALKDNKLPGETAKEYNSEKLGKAILSSIEKNEKIQEEQPQKGESQSQSVMANAGGNPEIGDFFNNSVFIGDSRMQGLMIYSGVVATGYTEQGLDVKSAIEKPIVFNNGSKITIPAALSLGHKFDRVIIKLGMNELGWRSTELFIQKYGELVSQIKKAQPEAKIYVHGILPVTAKKSSDGTVYNMPRINEFNGLIKTMAGEQGVNYIDIGPMLADAQGFLPEEGVAADGIHLKSDFCKKWIVCIKKAIEAK